MIVNLTPQGLINVILEHYADRFSDVIDNPEEDIEVIIKNNPIKGIVATIKIKEDE